MKKNKWTILKADPEKEKSLQSEMPGTRQALCSIFVQRGLDTFEKAKYFFTPSLEKLHDPFLLKDMDKAVKRITKAIQHQEKILLYGDYDVDGTTAVAVMYQYISNIYNKSNIGYYIPDRQTEGYGLSETGLDFARNNGFTLIIALDCGITSTALIKNAGALLEFIICDHHIPSKHLPDAVAILNPKQEDCSYPYKELCGCGIAFKLITAINQQQGLQSADIFDYLDYVAIAIGADIVPLTGENRILCYHGLEKLNQNPAVCFKALKEVAGNGYYDNERSVFQLAPRINAAGRMDHGKLAVQLLIAHNNESALNIAKVLQDQNEERKSLHQQVTMEALEIINQERTNRKSTVVHKAGWHKGVLGIVASKLIETHYRPTIILTTQDGAITGSARSVKGFDLYDALCQCRDHLVQFGGHTAAAGLKMLPEQLEPFTEKFEQVVSENVSEDQLTCEVKIDAELDLANIDNKFYNTLKRMEPFGPENARPVFLTRNVIPSEYTRLLKERHIKFLFQSDDHPPITGIGFYMQEKFSEIKPGHPIDIVYTITENHWNDQTTLQLRVIDFRPSEKPIISPAHS